MRTFFLLLLLTSPVTAAPVTITLTDDEQKAFLTILDVASGGALKPGGLEMAKAVTLFWSKLNPPSPPPPPAFVRPVPKPEESK